MRTLIRSVLLGILLAGCAAGPNQLRTQDLLASGDCSAAIRLMEESKDRYGANSELVFLMDSAMVYLQCADFKKAQDRFHEAERLADSLWTESISRNAASLVTSDYLLKYAGEDYERVMIHLMSAIGYLESKQLDEALVECRRLDSLLRIYNSKYEEKNVYREDAFARYLSGILREEDGELDDAFIDYLLAARTYKDYRAAYGTPTPDALKVDLFRMAAAVGRMEDALEVVDEIPDRPWTHLSETRAAGKIVFIQLSGDAPFKVEDRLYIPAGRGPITLAFPRMITVPPPCSGGKVILRSAAGADFEADLELVEDINRIAVKNLDDRKARVIARTLARAVAKQILIEGVSRQGDEEAQAGIRAVLNLLNIFIEHADTRSWRMLPGEIHLARIFVPEGEYTVSNVRCGTDGAPIETVRVAEGETRYVVYDTRYSRPGKDGSGERDRERRKK